MLLALSKKGRFGSQPFGVNVLIGDRIRSGQIERINWKRREKGFQAPGMILMPVGKENSVQPVNAFCPQQPVNLGIVFLLSRVDQVVGSVRRRQQKGISFSNIRLYFIYATFVCGASTLTP